MTDRRANTASGILAVILVGAFVAIALVYGLSISADARKRAAGPAEQTPTPQTPGVAADLPAAPVVFAPEEVDFGTLAPRTTSTATITLRNTGAEPLTLRTMKASCKCTTLDDLSGTVIAPGATANVTASMDGREAGGTATSTIRFVFDGYAPATVKLRAAYRRAVTAMPPFLDAMEGQTSGQVEVTAEDGRPFRILSVNGGDPRFEDYDPASGELRDRYAAQWDITAYDPRTCRNEAGQRMPLFIVFETDHPDAPVVEVLLRHRCNFPEPPGERRWIPLGKHRVVGLLAPGDGVEVEIPLRWIGEGPPDERFELVRCETDGVAAELLAVTEIDGRPTCRVRVTPVPEYRGPFTANLRIHGTRTSAPFVVIGTVRDE